MHIYLISLQRKRYLSVASKQRAQGCVDIKHADIALPQSVADIGFIDCNLAAEYELRIGLVLGNGSDLQLRLHLPLQPNINVVDHVLTDQMPALGQLTARHPNRHRPRTDGGHQIHHR